MLLIIDKLHTTLRLQTQQAAI